MGHRSVIDLQARDGHILQAYSVQPEHPPAVNLIVLHEIFGITDFIKDIAHQYAEQGIGVTVPALFDRIESNTVIPYDQAERGKTLANGCAPKDVLMDIQAACDHAAPDRGHEQTAVIGFCWGGTYAYLAACELNISAAISYYGTRIHEHLDRKPKHPVQFHFGENDTLVPPQTLKKIRDANPCQSIYLYPGAGHGFACTARNSYHQRSAEKAYTRTLAFLARIFNNGRIKRYQNENEPNAGDSIAQP